MKFARFIADGDPTLTITVKVVGATSGQVDFQTFEKDGDRVLAKVLDSERLSGSDTLTVTAPAHFDDPIYVGLVPIDANTGDGGVQQTGGAEKPITLDGHDVTVTITAGEHPDWMRQSVPPPNDQPDPDPSAPHQGDAPAVGDG